MLLIIWNQRARRASGVIEVLENLEKATAGSLQRQTPLKSNYKGVELLLLVHKSKTTTWDVQNSL